MRICCMNAYGGAQGTTKFAHCLDGGGRGREGLVCANLEERRNWV